MVNHWGREGQVSPNGAGTSALITVGVVCLLLGSAAGYGGARFLNPVVPAASKDTKPAADPALEKVLSENSDLKRKIETLQAGNVCPAPPDIPLYVQSMRNHMETMELELADYAKVLKSTRSELDLVSVERDQLKKMASGNATPGSHDMTPSEIEREALRGQLERTQFEVDRCGNMLGDTQRLLQEVSDKRAYAEQQAKELLKVSDQAKVNFEAQLVENSRIATENTALRQQLERLRQQTDEQLARLRSESARLTKALDEANKAVAEAEAKAAPAETPKSQQPATQPSEPNVNLTQRDGQQVDQAMQRAPGLKVLSLSQRQTVRDALLNGACVTDTLEDVFTRVPVLTLRSLIRDLDSPC